MKWVLEYLKPLGKRISAGITVKVIGTLAELMIPFLLSYILDNVIKSNNVGRIVIYGVIMAACALIACIGNIVANRMAAKTTMLFATRMRRELFSKTLNLSARETDKFTIPSLESRITSDTYNVQNFIGMMQRMGIRAPILLLGGSAITLIMDSKLSLVMIAIMPLIFIVVYSISRMGVPLYSRVQQSVDGMVRVVREDAQGIRVIKALSKVDYENGRYDKANMTLRRNESRAGIIMSVVNPIMTLLMNLGIVAVIAVSAHFVATNRSTAATIIAFMQYFTLISMAMMSLSRMFVMYTKCAASANRIASVMECESELGITEDDSNGDESYHISFENVTFSYLGKKDNVKNVSFKLKRGERLGIIGATGSGKSTVLRLLMRFYDADSGTVRINGKDVRSYTPEERTRMFGVVFQNDFIYADTVEENIRFGRDITRDEIIEAAKLAQAHDFVMSFPDGYDTYIEQGGTNVSGGQKQRLCIARALLKKPKIIILDDSTSAVDTATDAKIRSAFREKLADTTTIIIAQRIASVMDADRIIVMNDGEIDGIGTHEELMRTNKIYKEVYSSQQKGVA